MNNSVKNIIHYEGIIGFKEIENILYNARQEIESFDVNGNIKKKLFRILVEVLDNINKHNDSDNNVSIEATYYSVFKFSEHNNFFVISTKNIINNNKIDDLSYRLNQVNKLPRKELRSLYEKIILNNSISEKGGAGLGLVDIAIKSSNAIEFSFEQINENYSNINLYIKVDKTN